MKKIFLGLAALLTVCLSTQAQQIAPMPIDSAVRVGVLPNGLTYYIRHNEQPKQRAEFHIAQAVGATLEEDHQNGLAHFLEHMCFNGTEHFPGKLIINYFESVGVNFGGNINAYTSLDKTVYRLSEVPTYREGIVDSALLVMHDWSCAVSLLGEEIDNERGVIREEWRTGNTASRRAWKHSMQIMFPGTRYATRDVIGDTAVINNFSYQAIRDYYHKWYGPDLQAIVVVGDIDVDKIEQKIKQLWADVPARPNRGVRPYVQIPDNKEPIVGIYKDKEGQRTAISLLVKHHPLPKEIEGTNVAYIQQLCHSLIGRMLSERLTEISMKPDAPVARISMGYFHFLPTLDAFEAEAIAKEGREKEAYALLLTEVEKMRRYGFTTDELERAKTAMLNDYERSYNERNNVRNINYVQEYIGHYLDHDPIPGIELEYDIVRQFVPAVNVEMLNQIAVAYVTDENRIICITAPDKAEVQLPTEDELKDALQHMAQLEIAAPEAKKIDSRLVKKAPKCGKIKKTSYNQQMGTTEWLLKNGIRVVFKPTEYKKDQILLSAWSKGGESLIATEDLPNAELATTAISFMGLGDFSNTDLQKVLSGKTADIDFSINANTESLSGSSSVKDLETLLQLTYLGFTAPRKDEEAFAALQELLRTNLRNRASNPKAVFQDSVQLFFSNYSDRTILVKEELVDQLNIDKCLAVYQSRFKNPADFIFTFVGNINPEDANTKRLILTWLGGMKTTKESEDFKDHHIRVPEGHQQNYFTHKMSTHTASNRIQYTSYEIPATLKNQVTMELIGRILGTRYLESIREREGGSYGVGTYGYVQNWPTPKAALLMQFDTDPDKQERLMQIIHEEVQNIIDNGPLASDLQKEKESMLKDYTENLEKNGWWQDAIEQQQKIGIVLPVEYEGTVNSITADTIRQLLSKLVKSGNVAEIVMLPE